MKKTLLSTLCLVSIFACKKEDPKTEPEPVPVDNVAPVITLNGKQKDTVLLLTTYVDPGASASDDKDGNITSKIEVTGGVNNTIPGSNTLTYTVKDQAGNSAIPVVRMVYVKPATTYFSSGNYMVASTSSTQNPGAAPTLTANSTYTSFIIVSAQSGVVQITPLNIGPVTSPTGEFGVNDFTFSLSNSPINASGLTFGSFTGTVSPSKTSFTIETKYYETATPNKFYEVKNIFTKQ